MLGLTVLRGRVGGGKAPDAPGRPDERGFGTGVDDAKTAEAPPYRQGFGAYVRRSVERAQRIARLTADSTALSDAVTVLWSMPTPHSVLSPTWHSM